MKCAGCGEEVEDLLKHRNCFEDRVDVDEEDGLKKELRDYIIKAEELAREVDALRTYNRQMRDKLARILNLTKDSQTRMKTIRDVLEEPLPPHDPLAVELSRENMLAEIDELLQDRGAWVGGRLDSIRALLGHRDSMRRLLRDIHRDTAPWVATAEEKGDR